MLGGGGPQARGPLLLETVSDRLMAIAPQAHIVVQEMDAVIGAVFCAMDMVELPVGATIRDTARWSYDRTAAGSRVRS